MIRVENISKQYRIGAKVDRARTLGEAVGTFITSPIRNMRRLRGLTTFRAEDEDDVIWALKNVSFEVKAGEVVGIIGRNGAGKSTLLKVLSRITPPSRGKVTIDGRVSSLLEVGTGFHMELTGRENIYLNGTILGMRKVEVDQKFDEIVDFSGVEKFIDTPVKRYSSGMIVRLAFSVAAHLEPEVLIVDEVLAVGDAVFQQKCIGKMNQVANSGRTVLFVSHNMAAVNKLCKYAILLENGAITAIASTQKAIDIYMQSGSNKKHVYEGSVGQGARQEQLALLNRVWLRTKYGDGVGSIQIQDQFEVKIEYALLNELKNIRIGIRLSNSDGVIIFTSHDTDPDGGGTDRSEGEHMSDCVVPGSMLNAGRYYLTVTCDQPMKEILFIKENVISFSVESGSGAGSAVPDGRLGVIRPSLSWRVE